MYRLETVKGVCEGRVYCAEDTKLELELESEGLTAEDWLLPSAVVDAGATEVAEEVAEGDGLAADDVEVVVELPLVAKMPPGFDGTLTDELCADPSGGVVDVPVGAASISPVDDACVPIVADVL